MLRRDFCLRTLMVGVAVTSVKATRAFAQASTATTQQRPNPNTFESGDFIWPKTPGQFVPYDSSRFQTAAAAEKQWYKERDAFVASVSASKNADASEKEAAASLSSMDFKTFRERYLADQDKQSGMSLKGGGNAPLYVGHVAILKVEAGEASVVEAITDRGHKVRKISYDGWLKERSNDLVWHGRLKAYDSKAREGISTRAVSQIGKPYNFWNFNLNDDSGFYCSKLAWQCIFRELGIAVDGNTNPKRGIWFSPKQFMNCSRIEMLNVPGSYGHP